MSTALTTAKKIEKQAREIEVAEGDLQDLDKAKAAGEITDQHLKDLLRLRTKLRGFIKIAEETYEASSNQRNAYTVLAFYTQYRELVAEIRQIEGQKNVAPAVFEQVIHPMVTDIFQNFIDTLFHIKSTLTRHLGPGDYSKIEDRFERLTKEHASYVNTARKEAKTKLDAVLAENG